MGETDRTEKKATWLLKAMADDRIRKYGLLFLVGLLVALYPFYGSMFQKLGGRMAIRSYEKMVERSEKADLAAMLQEAREYNRIVAEAGKFGSFASQAETVASREEPTALEENGTMAWLEIPALKVSLPIHGRGMGSGITQVQGSSLPVGEADSHCVIADKGGWPGIRQLKKLDSLEEGDYLYLHVLGKTLAYRVEEIQVAEATASDLAAVKPGDDVLTLVAPAGSDRLIVSGRRTDFSPSIYNEQRGR